MKERIKENQIEKLFSVKDKIVFITGAGGLGSYLAQSYVKNGACVILANRTIKKAEAVLELLSEEEQKRFWPVAVEITKKEEIDDIASKIVQKYGKIDVLIHTAAVAAGCAPEEYPPDVVREIIDINLTGSIFVTQSVGKVMMKQGFGKIILIGSTAGVLCHTYESMPYEASKAGVHSIVKSFAACYGKYNINVNAVAPTWIYTPMLDDMSEAYKKNVEEQHILGRMSEVEDIFGACVFLSTDASNFVSGHTLLVDGAWSVAKPVVNPDAHE